MVDVVVTEIRRADESVLLATTPRKTHSHLDDWGVAISLSGRTRHRECRRRQQLQVGSAYATRTSDTNVVCIPVAGEPQG